MQLSLADFDCDDAVPPSWLPADKWEDILAVSVLPGPLDSLCVHMARDADAWKNWYHSDKPEDELLPTPAKDDSQGTYASEVYLRCILLDRLNLIVNLVICEVFKCYSFY